MFMFVQIDQLFSVRVFLELKSFVKPAENLLFQQSYSTQIRYIFLDWSKLFSRLKNVYNW